VSVGFGTDLMGPLEDEQLNGLRLQAEVDRIWIAAIAAAVCASSRLPCSMLGTPLSIEWRIASGE
jgi:hypothetical protein